MLLAEEVMAGRTDVLTNLPVDQLQKVLDEIVRKRKCDAEYLRDKKKKKLIRQLPQIPDIQGAKAHVCDQCLLASDEFVNAVASASLELSSVKAWHLLYVHVFYMAHFDHFGH